MTDREKYEKLRKKLYSFLRTILVSKFGVKRTGISQNTILNDLGLEPEDWYKLAAMIEHKYNITFTNEDYALFDMDNPTVVGCIQMTARRMGCHVPLDEDILARVALVIERATGISRQEITPDKLLLGMGIDSYYRALIASECEDEFGMKIPDQDLTDFSDVEQLVRYVSIHRFMRAMA